MDKVSEFLRRSRYRLWWVVGGTGATVCSFKLADRYLLPSDSDAAFFSTQNRFLEQQRSQYKDLTFSQLVTKAVGAGEDWMANLPIEKRIKFWLWPWADWRVIYIFLF